MLCEEGFKKSCEASYGMFLENLKEDERKRLYAAMAREVVKEGGREGGREGGSRGGGGERWI